VRESESLPKGEKIDLIFVLSGPLLGLLRLQQGLAFGLFWAMIVGLLFDWVLGLLNWIFFGSIKLLLTS
jgi:hypothetical protein